MEDIQKKSQQTSEEDPLLIPDHGYDGIRELDNAAPPWIVWLFFGSIIFAIFYLVNYHVFKQAPLQAEEYQGELQLAEAKLKDQSPKNEKVLTQLSDKTSLEAGKLLFTQRTCISCHGSLGEGNAVGPNLTDEYWIHGNKFENIIIIIKEGFLQKGMPSFSAQIPEEDIAKLASYVLSLQGSNPPNAKAPQGEKTAD
jgi:cytochrome c oxidase cbb3-type subunit III